MDATWLTQTLGVLAFAAAILHTFLAGRFKSLAEKNGSHTGFWRLLGEVEIAFGLWAALFLFLLGLASGPGAAVKYLESASLAEPAFVFAVMIVASTRPVVDLAMRIITRTADKLPGPKGMTTCFTALSIGPLLGSFITEPAAMTVTALILSRIFFRQSLPESLKYAMLGTLFVNISIGGVLTHFAAPPVIMSARIWGWESWDIFSRFGWIAILAVTANALLLTVVFAGPLKTLDVNPAPRKREPAPAWITCVHLAALVLLVTLLHHPAALLAVLAVFLGFADAYEPHQSKLYIRPALFVGVFLAGLALLGPQQRFWIQPLIAGMDRLSLYFGALGLTAITDNAALTYLGALVEQFSDQQKVALLAGAVTGGGLTLIANAPNPAGHALLKHGFKSQTIRPLGLFLGALVPTAVAAAFFLILGL